LALPCAAAAALNFPPGTSCVVDVRQQFTYIRRMRILCLGNVDWKFGCQQGTGCAARAFVDIEADIGQSLRIWRLQEVCER